jgi:predicted dehydrogenase
MRILLIGLGSIGKRHLSYLKSFANIELAALRTYKGTYHEKTNLKEFSCLEDALSFNPEGVIICNPTSLHVETALPFLKRNIKVLIEKPLADNTADCEKLKPYGKNILVAYCMRFLPICQFVHELKNLENIFKVSFKRSYYLPKWHPYADYRTEYTAQKKLGGGVIRTLSHEIDLMIFWFGKPKSVTGVTDKISHLETDTDDFAFFTAKSSDGIRINFELDLFSPTNIDTGELFTEKGKYFWDSTGLWFTPYDNTEPGKVSEFDSEVYDLMYINQLQDFIDFINGKPSMNATFQSSLEVLEIIESIDEPK